MVCQEQAADPGKPVVRAQSKPEGLGTRMLVPKGRKKKRDGSALSTQDSWIPSRERPHEDSHTRTQ